MQVNDIIFFQCFQDDIFVGCKIIIICDVVELYFKFGDVLCVGCYEDDGYFCIIVVIVILMVMFDMLIEQYV